LVVSSSLKIAKNAEYTVRKNTDIIKFINNNGILPIVLIEIMSGNSRKHINHIGIIKKEDASTFSLARFIKKSETEEYNCFIK
jgi:hypothetical protein